MKTGTILLVPHGGNGSSVTFANECARYLESKGRHNVSVAVGDGNRTPFEVMSSMFNEEGVDTFCILPLCISEGMLTVWRLPERLHLPDNAGSWTMVGDHDVATRFSTALGTSERMSEAILDGLGQPNPDRGAVLLFHGSELSVAGRVAQYYRERMVQAGWKCSEAFAKSGPVSPSEAVVRLISQGCGKVTVVPFYISADGGSYSRALSEMREAGIPVEESQPISRYPVFMEILDSKVPEDW